MNIELVTIGEELLLGQTVDTNAAFLATSLAAMGVSVVRHSTVGDERDAIRSAVGAALDRTGAVITTGGLGPTSDDITKPAIASIFGREMQMSPAVLRSIEERFRSRGGSGALPAANAQQAMVPAGARVLTNRHGTAPGIWIEDDRGRWVAMLPGVPREMRGLFADEIAPALADRVGDVVVRSRTLRTTGIAESALADMIDGAGREHTRFPLAYLPGLEGVDLRVTVRGLASGPADRALDDTIAELRRIVGRYVYGTDRTDLAGVVLDACRARGWHIAAGESCTGGLVLARLTAIPGASDTVRGGVIAYDNAVKTDLLGVDPDLVRVHGAVSEPVVLAMARLARERVGSELGIGVSGIAGPGGGTPEKPVGMVWIAVDAGGAATSRVFRFLGERDEVRARAAQAALAMCWRALSQGTGNGEQGPGGATGKGPQA